MRTGESTAPSKYSSRTPECKNSYSSERGTPRFPRFFPPTFWWVVVYFSCYQMTILEAWVEFSKHLGFFISFVLYSVRFTLGRYSVYLVCFVQVPSQMVGLRVVAPKQKCPSRQPGLGSLDHWVFGG